MTREPADQNPDATTDDMRKIVALARKIIARETVASPLLPHMLLIMDALSYANHKLLIEGLLNSGADVTDVSNAEQSVRAARLALLSDELLWKRPLGVQIPPRAQARILLKKIEHYREHLRSGTYTEDKATEWLLLEVATIFGVEAGWDNAADAVAGDDTSSVLNLAAEIGISADIARLARTKSS